MAPTKSLIKNPGYFSFFPGSLVQKLHVVEGDGYGEDDSSEQQAHTDPELHQIWPRFWKLLLRGGELLGNFQVRLHLIRILCYEFIAKGSRFLQAFPLKNFDNGLAQIPQWFSYHIDTYTGITNRWLDLQYKQKKRCFFVHMWDMV